MRNLKIEKTDSQCVVTWEFLLFGKCRVVLNENGLESSWTGLVSNKEHRVSLADIRLFQRITRSHKGRASHWLQAVCQGKNKNIDYSSRGGRKEIDDLCDQLNAFLVKLKTGGLSTKWNGIPEPITLGFNSSPQHIEPPLKCQWCYQTDFDGFGFQKRGADNTENFFAPLGCAVLFGGVIATIAFLRGKFDDPFLLFFALPVLYCVVRALYGLIELLFRRTTWTFTLGEARFRTVLLAWARTVNYELTDWSSLVVQISEAERHHTKELELDCDSEKVCDYYNGGDCWQLAFLNSAGEQLMAIEKLRKPDALWMADVVLREKRTIR